MAGVVVILDTSFAGTVIIFEDQIQNSAEVLPWVHTL